jgi:hypothetical protein
VVLFKYRSRDFGVNNNIRIDIFSVFFLSTEDYPFHFILSMLLRYGFIQAGPVETKIKTSSYFRKNCSD